MPVSRLVGFKGEYDHQKCFGRTSMPVLEAMTILQEEKNRCASIRPARRLWQDKISLSPWNLLDLRYRLLSNNNTPYIHMIREIYFNCVLPALSPPCVSHLHKQLSSKTSGSQEPPFSSSFVERSKASCWITWRLRELEYEGRWWVVVLEGTCFSRRCQRLLALLHTPTCFLFYFLPWCNILSR